VFSDAAALIALHMLRERAAAHAQRRARAGVLATALDGGPGAHVAARQLGIATAPAVVIAMGVDTAALPAARAEAERHRLAAADSRSEAAVLDGVT